MDPSALVVALAVGILVGWLLAQPLVRPTRGRSAASREISLLEGQVDQVTDRMRELDLDHDLGKIPAEDYLPRRIELLAQGAQILKELDRQRHGVAQLRSRQEESLEREIAARRHGSVSAEPVEAVGTGTSRAAKPALNSELGSRRAGLCHRCGQAVQVGDRFCARCGQALTHAV
jgi:hypothetical protein